MKKVSQKLSILNNKTNMYDCLFDKTEFIKQQHTQHIDDAIIYSQQLENKIIWVQKSQILNSNEELFQKLGILEQSITFEYQIFVVIYDQNQQEDLNLIEKIKFLQKYQQNIPNVKFIGFQDPQLIMIKNKLLIKIIISQNNQKHKLAILNCLDLSIQYQKVFTTQNSIILRDECDNSLFYLFSKMEQKIKIIQYSVLIDKMKLLQKAIFSTSFQFEQYIFGQKFDRIIYSINDILVLLAKNKSTNLLKLFGCSFTLQNPFSIQLNIYQQILQDIDIQQNKKTLIRNQNTMIRIRTNQSDFILSFSSLTDQKQEICKYLDTLIGYSNESLNMEYYYFMGMRDQDVDNIFLHNLIIKIPIWYEFLKNSEPTHSDLISRIIIEHTASIATFIKMSYLEIMAYSIVYGLLNNAPYVITVLRYVEILLLILCVNYELSDMVKKIWNFLPIYVLPKILTYQLVQSHDYQYQMAWVQIFLKEDCKNSSDFDLAWLVLYKLCGRNTLINL